MKIFLSSLNLFLVALLASHGAATHARPTSNSNERRLGDPAVRGDASPRRNTNYDYTSERPRHVHNEGEASRDNYGVHSPQGITSNDSSRNGGQNGRYLMDGRSRSKRVVAVTTLEREARWESATMMIMLIKEGAIREMAMLVQVRVPLSWLLRL